MRAPCTTAPRVYKKAMSPCEIIYVKDAKGWKWRTLSDENVQPKTSEETFQLFYDCVSAARAKGYKPNIRCP